MRIVERSTPSMNSRARRDLPTPGAPNTVTRCTRLSRTTRANVLWSSSISSSRPTSGTETTSRRPTSSATETTRHASTPSGKPRASCAPSGVVTTMRRVRLSTVGPSMISPGWAACCRRAAALIARPVANVVSVSSERISPVSIPIRTSRPSLPTPSTMPSAARTARSGSSSCANGTPNAAITASPENFWTMPPCVMMQWVTWSKKRFRRERTTSGSALATSCVEPTRSTKRTVASLRSIPEG